MDFLDFVENADRKREEEALAFAEGIGAMRRLWRELRAGLAEEGVPSDMLDEVTLHSLKAATSGGKAD
ncbi:hypothetical protein [uncultured Corynebacterium sp.]|uniref:hypothetical protein n=1 Tax=uncultured Corynebacterium sp. TaxID=159447 RepID=UPI002597B53C|nr:hypothetical protein [uncultured Corynebacterium sp.]